MPRYFFDIDDGELATIDDTGIELVEPRDIENQAVKVLPDIAREALPDGLNRAFSVNVRDTSGAIVFKATLILHAGWI